MWPPGAAAEQEVAEGGLRVEEFRTVVTQKYADFSGRASRREYWMFVLVYVVAMLAISAVGAILTAMMGRNGAAISVAVNAVVLLGALALIIPSLAVTVRRLHDAGHSGLWWLITFVPFGGIVLLIFALQDSQPGDNQWGPNPKGISAPAYPSPSPAA